MTTANAFPSFADLPAVKGQPQGCAWGLWGEDDQLGTLNKISQEVITAAAREIQTGQTASLDMRLDAFPHRLANRRPLEHKILDFYEKEKVYTYDDELHFNTQSSSQWDGFKHWASQKTGAYYNNLHHTDAKKDKGRNGIHKWVENGGIVGRGVLLDYVLWREETGLPPADSASTYSITVAELEEVAKHFKVEFRLGDILFVRSGFTKWHEEASDEERVDKVGKFTFIGVENSMKTAEWLWNKHFAAVATDSLAFEVCPPPITVPEKLMLHDWILSYWGMPLGELFNLETIAQLCQKEKRWSFFVTSAPLNVFGGVASPPNAIAIL